MAGMQKNTALTGLMFVMTDSTYHKPSTSNVNNIGYIYIAKDGGAMALSTNRPYEVGRGWYALDLTASEMNANNIAIVVLGAGGVLDDHHIHLITQ